MAPGLHILDKVCVVIRMQCASAIVCVCVDALIVLLAPPFLYALVSAHAE
jgi:hypothetical protein